MYVEHGTVKSQEKTRENWIISNMRLSRRRAERRRRRGEPPGNSRVLLSLFKQTRAQTPDFLHPCRGTRVSEASADTARIKHHASCMWWCHLNNSCVPAHGRTRRSYWEKQAVLLSMVLLSVVLLSVVLPSDRLSSRLCVQLLGNGTNGTNGDHATVNKPEEDSWSCPHDELFIKHAVIFIYLFIVYLFIYIYLLYIYLVYIYLLYIYWLYIYWLYIYWLYIYLLYIYLLYIYFVYIYLVYIYFVYIYEWPVNLLLPLTSFCILYVYTCIYRT